MRPDTPINWDNLVAVGEGHYAATDRGTAAAKTSWERTPALFRANF